MLMWHTPHNGNEQVTVMYSNRGAFHECDAECKKPDKEGHTWAAEASWQSDPQC